MKDDFANSFADFLGERLGDALNTLREKNTEYRLLSDEHYELLNSQYQSVDECNQAISRISVVRRKLDDIEKHYLFLAGMREYARIGDALLSEEFEIYFVG